MDDEKLLDALERSHADRDPKYDITKMVPGLTNDDAYRLQLGLKRRMAKRGDPHVGYRISLTSRKGMQEAVALGIVPQPPEGGVSPVFSSLSASNIGSPSTVVKRHPDYNLYAEAEVSMVMAKRLSGPGITAAVARDAVGGLYASLDMAQVPKNLTYGFHHLLAAACVPVDTQVVLGSTMTPPNIDLRLEGILVSVDGEPRASATAWESLGDPMVGIAWLANELAKHGEALEPGQIVVTGVCPYPQCVKAGEKLATAEFTRLGSVTARVSA